MALVEQNIFRIKGKIAGLSFYKINGKNVVRKSFGPTAKTINTNPNYSSVKNNNQEFAGAAQLSKAIRGGLGSIGKEFQDAYMASRLTGICRTIISNGKGNFGEREANLKTNQHKIVGFSLIKNKALKSVFKAEYNLQISENNKEITISFPSINTSDFLKTKSFTTLFKITAIAICIATYKYNKKQHKYLPQDKDSSGVSASASTQLLSITQSHKPVNLSLSISNTSPTTSKTNAIIWLGCSTYSSENKNQISPVINKVMQCIAVV